MGAHSCSPGDIRDAHREALTTDNNMKYNV
jgi:hypothetical protein